MQYRFKYRDIVIDLQIKGKFNVIVGNSGTGKSYLAKLAEDIRQSYGSKSNAVQIAGDYKFVEMWKDTHQGAIVVVDEGLDLDIWHKVVKDMMGSRNYYIICTREGNGAIPYGIDTTFKLERTKTSIKMVSAYDTDVLHETPVGFTDILTEYSKLGLELVRQLAGSSVKTSNGKSKLASTLSSMSSRSVVLFDSCGIGCDLDELLSVAKVNRSVLYDSKSFEFELLKCFDDISHCKGYIDECLYYPSEEKYYESTLKALLCKYFGISYDKSDTELAGLFYSGVSTVNGKFTDISELCNVERIYEFLRNKHIVPASHNDNIINTIYL